jgi:hypothetical protein
MTLSSIQQGVADLLKTDAFLVQSQASALFENDGDLESLVEHALASVGLMVLVLTPTVRRNGAGAIIDATTSVVVQVVEIATVNRARAGYATAMDMAEHVACVLDNAAIPPAQQPLSFVSLDPVTETASLAYNVRFQTRAILTKGTPQ